jgi:O-antigen ligase
MTNDLVNSEVERRGVPWVAILIVAGAFFVLEHRFDAQSLYQQLIGAQNMEELEGMGQLFETRAERQGAGMLLGAIGLFLILRKRKPLEMTIGFLGGMLLFYLAWNSLSVVWSDEPGLVFRRLALLYMIVLGAVGLSTVLSLRDILLLAMVWPALYLVAGVAAEVAGGSFRPWTGGYRFAGTIHPNAQGVNCAMLVLAAVCYYPGAQRKKLVLLTILVALVFLYLTKSRTALASVIAVGLMHWGMLQSHSGKVALASAAVALIAFGVLFSEALWPRAQDIVKMGRTDVGETTGTLTGRRDLWEQLSGFAAERPVLGHGYGAFWNEERSREVIDEQGWPISHAHNAFIDVYLEGGPLAMLTYTLILIVGVTLAISYVRQTRNPAYTFFSTLLLFCLLNGLLESVPVQRSQVTFIATLVLVSLAFRNHPLPGWFEAPAPAEEPGHAVAHPGAVVQPSRN